MSMMLIKISLLLILLIVVTNSFIISKKSLSSSKISLMQSTISSNILNSFDYNTNDKLPWIPSGYKTFIYNNYKVNYVDLGNDNNNDKPPILLIHGFGASVYHWRYNIPTLARDYRVYAIDLLGFGLSEKPIIEYNAEVWRDQALSFIENVIYKETGKPCVVAGNSLGGFTALYAASNSDEYNKKLISGCILLNAAGRFKSLSEDTSNVESKPEWQEKITATIQRFVIGLSFIYTKQPARIEQVLRQVYPVNPNMVDRELVDSIQYPAQDPNAAEVFYRVIKKNGNGPPTYVDDLLAHLKMPLLLLWGEKDPWIRMNSLNMLKELYPKAAVSIVDAGHCAHDEAPVETNRIIKDWISKQVKI